MDHFLTHGRLIADDSQQQQPLTSKQRQQQPLTSKQPSHSHQQQQRRRYYDYILYIDMDVVIMDLDR